MVGLSLAMLTALRLDHLACYALQMSANDEICQEVATAGGVQLALQILKAGTVVLIRHGACD